MVGKFGKTCAAALALPIFACGSVVPVAAEPLVRAQQAAGAVIARKVGEEVRFVDVSDWRYVDLKQDLVAGDVLRTNGTGQLAILFSDRTQVRLGRNSSLVVKQITAGTSADTILQLESGTIWARAERGGPGVKVETPAAAAAIRGTDWTMTVQGAKTSLNVLEGVVQLTNPQGSVDVGEGEGAVASIGQAPKKIVIVDSDDREQMLYYLTPRNAFNFMPASPVPVSQMRRELDRVSAISVADRTAEDQLSLAEAAVSLEGRERARAELALLDRRHLSAHQSARADLLAAIIAAGEGRYQEAADLFESASPRLDARRRGIAAYGEYYSRSLANPSRVETAPVVVNSPYDALLKAYVAGFLEDIPSAIAVIRSAEGQFPDDPTLPAYRAQLAILLNDRTQVEESLKRAFGLDPTEPTALEARANYRGDFRGDIEGALADLMAAAKVVPGSTTIWNAIGNVQAARGDDQSAEEAFKKSIALDPQDPLSYSNLANLYLNQSRVEEARALIDKAMALDASFDMALVVRGRYFLQTGHLDKAVDDMLAGTVANPAYSQGQALLAATHYEKGDRIAAGQALDNADRLDDNDPAISAFRTAVAIDEYDADGAMRNAREFLKRSRARGGYYASLGASQDAGSTLNGAFRLQGLDAWGQYYGDAVFDPFSGTSYLDQVVRGNVNPLANSFDYGGDIINNTSNNSTFSSLVQGLLFEPHMIAGRSRSANLAQSPFLEGAIGGGLTSTEQDTGWIGSAEVQGFSNEPVPISAYATFSFEKLTDTTRQLEDDGLSVDLDHEVKLLNGTAYLTASPTPDDRFVGYLNYADGKDGLDWTAPYVGPPFPGAPDIINYPYLLDSEFTTAGLGWSHTVEYHNVINVALFYTSANVEIDDSFTLANPTLPMAIFTATESTQKNYVGAISHTYGVDDLTWRYGVEGGMIDETSDTSLYALGVPPVLLSSTSDNLGYGRIYGDLLHEITPELKAEYGLHAVLMQGDDIDVRRLEPRVGIAWSPAEGQWLRAGFIRQGTDMSTPTLSPIGVLGIQANGFGVGIEGYSDTAALRWDAEWNDWLFTAVDYQHQMFRNISVADVVSQASYDYEKATVDRLAVTANIALGHGFGLAGTYAYAQSRHNVSTSALIGENLPFLPEHSGRIALTRVSPANIKTTIAANYVGERQGDNTPEILDDFWTLDARLTWEPFDKRFELEAAAYNLLSEDFQVATTTNGWGRVFKGTLKVRF
jgi:tetratricopeptide (TPR) repeat protein